MKPEIKFEQGILTVTLATQVDKDQDGVLALEAGAYVKANVVESVGEANIPALQKVMPIIEKMVELLLKGKA